MLHKDLTGADLHINKVHATTHVEIGTDPLVLAESQVADLVADLADKVEIDDARLSDARVPTAHDHAESGVTNLVTDLSGKAPLVHGHVKADVADFPVSMPASDVSAWAKEASLPVHIHFEDQVWNLVADLAGKVDEGDVRLADAREPTAHSHVKADITDFPILIPGTGNGDVVGPVSVTPGNVATYLDETGKNIGDGGAIPTTLPASDVSAWAKEGTKPAYTPSEIEAEAVANKSISVPTDAVSDVKYPSVKAVKDYADGLLAGLLSYRGAYDASGNVYPATGGSGTAGAVMKGDMWAISVAGALGGVAIQGGDIIIANINTPAQTAANWNTLNTNISYVPENQANKENTTLDTSTVKYPTNNLVKIGLDGKASKTVSATDKLLGRATAGAGDIEEIPLTPAGRALIDDASAAAQLATLGTAAYSEGTWPIGIAFGGNAVGVVYEFNTGRYVKIGKLVTVTGLLTFTSLGSSTGNVTITGLPFASGAGLDAKTAASLHAWLVTFTGQLQGNLGNNSAVLGLDAISAGTVTNLDKSGLSQYSQFQFSITYYSA